MNYSQHYKEKQPSETIKNVETFFQNKNCQIKSDMDEYSEANTYTYCAMLYWHGRPIHHANGKGMTREYAMASCYAELYERFCAFAFSLQSSMNKILYRDVSNINYKNKGYYFHKNEKELTYLDLLNDRYATYMLNNIYPTLNKTTIEDFINTYQNGKCIGLPYYGLEKNDIEYHNLSILNSIIGTTGYAAGNTLEEAVTQGASELFERYGIYKFYSTNQKEYYYITKENLPEEIQKIIDNIQKENPFYDIKVYDLSYNFNIPTCMLLINDITNHLFYINFGAAPVFALAVERCFTEIYQGCKILPVKNKIIKRPADALLSDTCLDAFNSAHKHENIVIPEGIILHSKEMQSFNHNIFLEEQEYSGQILVQKIEEYGRLNDLHIYWTDISLTSSIRAVHVIFQDCLPEIAKITKHYFLNNSMQKNQIMNITKYFLSNIELAISKQDISLDDIEIFINKSLELLNNFDTNDLFYGFDVMCATLDMDIYDIFNIGKSHDCGNYKLFFNLITSGLNNIAFTQSTSLKYIYQNYILEMLYLEDHYSLDDIQNILNYLGLSYFDIDANNFSILYLIKKVFVDTLYDLYHSNEYYEYIKLFTIN